MKKYTNDPVILSSYPSIYHHIPGGHDKKKHLCSPSLRSLLKTMSSWSYLCNSSMHRFSRISSRDYDGILPPFCTHHNCGLSTTTAITPPLFYSPAGVGDSLSPYLLSSPPLGSSRTRSHKLTPTHTSFLVEADKNCTSFLGEIGRASGGIIWTYWVYCCHNLRPDFRAGITSSRSVCLFVC